MVSCTTRKIISLAISLLVVVISLTGVALGATAPTVSSLSRFTPGFAGLPGKMARDAAGNFYVTDFWGKGIVKLDRLGNKIGFIATNGRPSAVAVLKDNRLVVAVTAPQAKLAFYSQTGVAPNVTGEEITTTPIVTPAPPIFRPTGITVDAAGNIYLVDAGDSSTSTTVNVGKVRVYSPAGTYLYAFGVRTNPTVVSTTLGEFKQPMGIAYEPQSNQIVVADTMNGRLQLFSAWNGTTCTANSSIGMSGSPVEGSVPVVFADPTDVAFEYVGTTLSRLYVTERARNEIDVVDYATGADLMRIPQGSTPVANAEMKYPSGVIFEKTATGGVLYVSNAPASNPANVLALGIDNGAIPVPAANQIVMNAVPAVAPANPITVTGTTSPASAVTCTANGVAGTVTGTGSWSASLNLQAGNNHIVCQSTSGGVTAYAEADTYNGVATGTVSVAISQPVTPFYTPNTSVTVSGTSDTANVTVSLSNGHNGAKATALAGADKKWSAVITVAEGNNDISAIGSKSGMNPSASATVTVVADYTAPALNISFLNSGATTNKAVQNIDGVVTDANLGSITVNGVAVPAAEKVTLTGTTTYFSVPITLVRGSNTITVTATDLAGNTMSSTPRTVTLIPETPGMTVDLPADNSYMSAAGAVIANGSSDPVFTAVNAAGTPVTPSAGAWSTAAMSVTAGFGQYLFTASGAGVPTVTEKRSINTDPSFNQVAIYSPAADLATNASSVPIKVSLPASNTTLQVSIDGAIATPVSGYTSGTTDFTYNPPAFTAQGLHTVKLIADGGTTVIRNIIYDTILPDISLQADTKVMPTTVTGTIEPSVKMSAITASFGGAPVTIPLSVVTFYPYDGSGAVTWQANLAGYTYDAISFTSVDPAGNSSTLAYKQGIPTGDIDGDGAVRLTDALAALRHVAGTEHITDVNKFFNGDVGGLVGGHAARDGVIDITDSVLILNKAYGLMSF